MIKQSEVLSLLLCYNFEREFNYFLDKSTIKSNDDRITWLIESKHIMEFNHNTYYLWCEYYNFWKVFEIKFNMNNFQIEILIKFMMKKYFSLNNIVIIGNNRLYYLDFVYKPISLT